MISYSQNQEDVLLARVFAGRPHGLYVDVGAHFPVIDSVTEHFYRLGWRGINIDPLPAAYAELCQVRVRDINLNLAIAEAEGEATFYALDGYSTLVADVATLHRQAGLAPRATTTRTRPLAAVLADHGVEHIDFLKVDVEGAELAVLASNDWHRFRPSLVLVEAVDPVTRAESHRQWEPLLIEAGYCFRHFDGVNRFYWNQRDLALPEASCFLPPNAFDGFTPYAVIAAEGRAAAAAREAAYERQRIGSLVSVIGAGLEALLRDAAAPAPDAALEAAWTAAATVIGQARALRQAVTEAIATLRGQHGTAEHHDDLGQALTHAVAQAGLIAHTSAAVGWEPALAADTTAMDRRELSLENETLRRMLALSEQRRLALVEAVTRSAGPAESTAAQESGAASDEPAAR
jgi:FkbM family methyltransferase